jgi:hypothetical protein
MRRHQAASGDGSERVKQPPAEGRSFDTGCAMQRVEDADALGAADLTFRLTSETIWHMLRSKGA